MSLTGPIAVIDIGKTNVKLVRIDPATGQELAALSQANRVRPGPPYPHHDVEAIWAFILKGLRDFARHGPVGGIAITTHGATAALIREGGLCLPVLDYEHDGPAETAAAYDAVRPDFAETLSPRLPAGLNLGAQLFWLSRTFPGAFARADGILMYPQYWAFRLTGQTASEVTSLGTHTDLWAPGKKDFSVLVDQEGWRRLMPALRRADHVLGPVLPDIAEATGLDPATPVACGIHDSNASLLPWLAGTEPPFNVISSGTWTIIMHVGGGTGGLDPARDCLANVDIDGRPVPTARFMGGRDHEAIMAGVNAAPTMTNAQTVISKGIMARPGWTRNVGPFPNGPGGWHGGAASLSPQERAAAASLYLALMTRACLALAGTGKRIIVEGPLARNAVYLNALADLVEAPVFASGDATGTSSGAAALFSRQSNLHDTLPKKPIKPSNMNGVDSYAETWLALADQSR